MLVHLHALEEAVYDETAEFGGERGEIGGEAGYAHDKVGMAVGVLVGLHELLGIEDVDVDEGAALAEMGLDLQKSYHELNQYFSG